MKTLENLAIYSPQKSKGPNPIKVTIWEDVLARELTLKGVLFERQYRVGSYVLDFLVFPNLAVEAEGTAHSSRQERDLIRTDYLQSLGLTVYRIPNYLIREDPEGIADMLLQQQRLATSKYPADFETSMLLIMEGLLA